MENSIYFRVLVCVIALFAVSCSNYFHIDKDGNIKSGFYKIPSWGVHPRYECYTRILNDTAYIDLFYLSVSIFSSYGPYHYYSDTILLSSTNKNKWTGKFTQIQLIDKKLYFSNIPVLKKSDISNVKYYHQLKLKDKEYEKEYYKTINLLKNKRLILRTQFKAYRLVGRDGLLFFQDFADQNNIFNMYDSLDHSNFQKEYQIFENKFFQELKPQKK